MYFAKCKQCGEWFSSRYKKSLCNRECELAYERSRYLQYYNKEKSKLNKRKQFGIIKKIKKCQVCHKEFECWEQLEIDKYRFCSNKCNKKAAKQRRDLRYEGAFVEYIDIELLYFRDHGRCQLCGRKLNKKLIGNYKNNNAPTVDHIIPLAKGGLHEYRNVQLACRYCNSMKGAKEIGQLRIS